MAISRRDFVRSAAGLATLGLGAGGASALYHPDPQTAGASRKTPRGKRPAVIGSANALRGSELAMKLIRDGADPVDAAVEAVATVEDDPNDNSVGLGGVPNEDGVVQLDACVMHGPTHKAGAVAAIEDIRNPSKVAKLVMWRTDHVLLVGEGAKRFALAHGFKEENLLTDKARRIWLKWKEGHSDKDDWLGPEESGHAGRREDFEGFTYGTCTCMALTPAGDLGGCTTTSGLAFKIPGRVGDSPIIGAGLYVDNEVGACGSTGRGEANLQNCSCVMIVELMRQGYEPQEACLEMLRRIAKRTEKRLRNARGEPNYPLRFYAIRKDGAVGGASMRGTGKMTYHDGTQARLIETPALYGE